jgi:CRP-like cAMP-binding protein
MSSVSPDDSSSSSSTSSSDDDDNENGILDLGASGWNRYKQSQTIQGKTIYEQLSSMDDNIETKKKEVGYQMQLLQKRIIPANLSGSESDTNGTTTSLSSSNDDGNKFTDLERAVLTDCLSNNFLFADHTDRNFDLIFNQFEKIKLRKNEIVVRKGTPADYLWILFQGDIKKIIDDDERKNIATKSKVDDNDGSNSKYIMLGELELLTQSTYKATYKASSQPCIFFRLSKQNFNLYRRGRQQRQHRPLSRTDDDTEEILKQLLQQALPKELVVYFKDDTISTKRLVSEMKYQQFSKNDVLVHKKNRHLNAVVVIAKGAVVASNISAGGRTYEDIYFGPGYQRISFGWQSVMNMNTDPSTNTGDDPVTNTTMMTGTIVAKTDGYAYVISKKAFENVFHNHFQHNHPHTNDSQNILDIQHLADLRWKRSQLQQITVFKDSILDDIQINGLLDLMHHCVYGDDEPIFKVGQKVDAGMYFVRQGSVRLESNKGKDVQIIEPGGYFGEKNMLLDQNKDGHGHHQKRSLMNAISIGPNTKVDILYLEECRKVINTTTLGLGASTVISSIDSSVLVSELIRHALLGTGSFGQVWLASRSTAGDEGEETKQDVYALKVQPKHQLLQADKAQRIVAERNILSSLHSPFIIRLYNACQDDRRLYMVTSLLQGGELEDLLPEDGLSESAAKFYAAGILEGLTYMHRRHIIHRDVKCQNCLLNNSGKLACVPPLVFHCS